MLSPGVEPGAPVPQTGILSIKLREQLETMYPLTHSYDAAIPHRGRDSTTIYIISHALTLRTLQVTLPKMVLGVLPL